MAVFCDGDRKTFAGWEKYKVGTSLKTMAGKVD